MKKLLVFVFIITIKSIFSQTETKLEFINETTVLLNDEKINKNTTFDEVKKLLGEPVLYKKYVTGKVNYHYKEKGISVHTMNGNLLFIGFNYNWDGDKTFPNTSYKGKLNIDGVDFDQNSTKENQKKIKNVEFMELMPGLVFSKPKNGKKNTLIILGYKDNKVTQIGFEFH